MVAVKITLCLLATLPTPFGHPVDRHIVGIIFFYFNNIVTLKNNQLYYDINIQTWWRKSSVGI